MEYLYYVQRVHQPIITTFIPKVPECRMSDENMTIPRITLSSTIEGCINAAPWGYSQIGYREENEVFRLYCFDKNKIKKNNFLCSRAIYNAGYVDDAVITKEVWVVNQNLVPDRIQYFKIGEYYDTEYMEIISYQERRKGIKEGCSFEIVKNLDIEFLAEDSLFQDSSFEVPENYDDYGLENAIPKETFWDFSEDGKSIVFPNPVVFCWKDILKEGCK